MSLFKHFTNWSTIICCYALQLFGVLFFAQIDTLWGWGLVAEGGSEEVGEESGLWQLLWLLINSSGVSRWWCPLVLETLFRP